MMTTIGLLAAVGLLIYQHRLITKADMSIRLLRGAVIGVALGKVEILMDENDAIVIQHKE